jgi:CDGSH-type Zn-finger protein
MDNKLPIITQRAPFKVDVKAKEKYFWCSCGLSKNQPFCDGGHKGSGFKPIVFEVSESKTIYFCGCRQTKNGVLCDGSHNLLP